MADLERLEAELSVELSAALRRYAAEADTSIDAAEAARAIARRHPRRRWLDAVGGTLPFPIRTAARVVLVAAALLALLLAAAFVGQRLLPDGLRESLLRGRLDCIQTAPGTVSTEGATVTTTGLTLECRFVTGDERTTGGMTLVVARTLFDGRNGVDEGTVTLTADRGTWTGELAGTIAETGARSASATLAGQGPFRDLQLSLSLIGSGSLSFVVTGTVGPSR